jgi:hypothetical protein
MVKFLLIIFSVNIIFKPIFYLQCERRNSLSVMIVITLVSMQFKSNYYFKLIDNKKINEMFVYIILSIYTT